MYASSGTAKRLNPDIFKNGATGYRAASLEGNILVLHVLLFLVVVVVLAAVVVVDVPLHLFCIPLHGSTFVSVRPA